MSLRQFLLLILLLLAARWVPAQAPRYALPAPEAPVALLPAGPHPYLVTRQGVWERRGRRLLPRYRSPLPLTAALLAGPDALWLGTTEGLRCLSLRTGQAHALAAAPPAPVTALLRDAGGHLWVGLAGHGAYELAGDSLVPRLRIPGISAGLATADGAVWLGTNLGLHRYQAGQWTRYNEEGVANHEIPDNLVEKLLPDGDGRVWVVMSEAVCLLDAAPAAGPGPDELPTARFVGQPGNAVYSVAYAPGQGWVLATDLGLLLLPGSQPQAGPAGFAPAPATDEIAPQRLLRPLPTGPGPRPTLVQRDAHGHLWLAAETGLTRWPARTLRRLAATPVAPPASARLAP